MIDSKFLLTIFAITIAVCTVFNQNPVEFIKEGFVERNLKNNQATEISLDSQAGSASAGVQGLNGQVKVINLSADPMPTQVSLSETLKANGILPTNGIESKQATRQTGEYARAHTDFWSCRSKPSDYANLAYIPEKPLNFEQSVASCNSGSYSCGSSKSNDLNAVKDMNSVMENPVIFDRQIGVQTRSRLQGLGCPIRGDVVCDNVNRSGWFSVSADPTALRAGAVGIITDATPPTGETVVQKQLRSVQTAMQRNVKIV
jgi:hypothetical protein